MEGAKVYLIPTVLDEDGFQALPAYILEAVKDCSIFFVENERTARRYLKRCWKEMVIDDYEWVAIGKDEAAVTTAFRQKIKEKRHIGVISEAGCPGVADPGQLLVGIAQQMGVRVMPLVGPSSILLALMGSGMNGQQFRFSGYLPIDSQQRARALKELEGESQKKNCTEIFIETPYRNNQLIDTLLKNLRGQTLLCIAADITGKNELIVTKPVSEWQKAPPDIHKRPALFLIYAGQ